MSPRRSCQRNRVKETESVPVKAGKESKKKRSRNVQRRVR